LVCKDKEKIKYRQLYIDKPIGQGTGYTWVELNDGSRRKMTSEERNIILHYYQKVREYFLLVLYHLQVILQLVHSILNLKEQFIKQERKVGVQIKGIAELIKQKEL
jgi:hypothetical protein